MKETYVGLVEPSYFGVSYAKSATSKGCKVVAIVSAKDNPAKFGYEGYYHDVVVADIRSPESVIQAIEDSPCRDRLSGIIAATDYALHVTAKVIEHFKLIGMAPDAALRARRKDLAREAYARAGVPGANHAVVKTHEDARREAARIGYPVVVKPTNCASSQNVRFVNDETELAFAAQMVMDQKESYMGFKVEPSILIEEFIAGPEFSIELFLHRGKPIFSAVTEKNTTPLPYFAEVLHVTPTSVCKGDQGRIIDAAVAAMVALGIYDGPGHVEIKLSQTGPRIVEANGRPGGDNISSDLLQNAFGYDIFGCGIDYCLGREVRAEVTKKEASSVAYLVADREGVVRNVAGVEQLAAMEGIVRAHITVRKGDAVRRAISSDDRLGFVISQAKTPEKAKELALNAIRSVVIEYGN